MGHPDDAGVSELSQKLPSLRGRGGVPEDTAGCQLLIELLITAAGEKEY
jgi:hypothetical protein